MNELISRYHQVIRNVILRDSEQHKKKLGGRKQRVLPLRRRYCSVTRIVTKCHSCITIVNRKPILPVLSVMLVPAERLVV